MSAATKTFTAGNFAIKVPMSKPALNSYLPSYKHPVKRVHLNIVIGAYTGMSLNFIADGRNINFGPTN